MFPLLESVLDMQSKNKKNRSFIDCSLGEKLLFTCFLLLTGLAYLMAIYYLYSSHQGHDGKPGISIEDIVDTYYGNRSGTRLEAAIRGPMAPFIQAEDRHVIVEWLKQDTPKADYSSKILPILTKTCLKCHTPASGLNIPDLSSYAAIREVTKLDTGESLHTLVKLSHIHLFGIGLVLLILGNIFLLTVLPGWIKYPMIVTPFLAVFIDILSWFLTKWDPVYAYTVIIAGTSLGVSLGAQILISLYQIWFLRSAPTKPERKAESTNNKKNNSNNSNNNNSILKTYLVVLGVCLVASFLVATAAVKLASRQKENQRLEKFKNILLVADLYDENADIDAVYNKTIEKQWINLKTGMPIVNSTSKFEKLSFDALAKNPEYSKKILPDFDRANIKRRPKYMPVYFVKKNQKLLKIILPVYGKGLWSTLYGFLALYSDAKTIAGITFYQQGETPGLGGEITNPRWQKLWQGKQAFDAKGNVIINVIKGEVRANSPDAGHLVDGLAGATLTSRGVNNLIHYWLGDDGFGPFLNRLKSENNAD
jgi:Na+-transporting NADH:ubiquinone oxidoreductase subunit C